jgi:hypothetical protein
MQVGSCKGESTVGFGKWAIMSEDRGDLSEHWIQPEEDQPEGLQCSICGSSEGVQQYINCGEVALLCDRHSVGVSASAESIYWRRKSSSESESNN